MKRLSDQTVQQLAGVTGPLRYDRDAVRTGVVHLGLGAFHRGHQALVFDDALATGDDRWGVLGVSLRSAAVRNQLVPQNGLYTVQVRDGAASSRRLVGAIRDVIVAPDDPSAVVTSLSHPDVHLVTLTVTEKGYHLGLEGLDRTQPDIAHDLAGLEKPRTAAGFIVAGLASRRAAGVRPFTTLSCDNLTENGHRLRESVLVLAAAHDPELADWIAAEAAFPCSMVDRIVPATTAADLIEAEAALGLRDEAMVKAEPFLQWVIEDRFSGPRPDFAQLGVTLVDDVAPWEAAKLRLLNGAHSTMAYLGGLADFERVDEFVAWPPGRAFVDRLWDEIAPTLAPTPGLDLRTYRSDLLLRFANSAMGHRLAQIASDGSKKLPPRLVASLAARSSHELDSPALALSIAGWMRWLRGISDAGVTYEIDDPLSRRLIGAAGKEEADAVVGALLEFEEVFAPAVARNPRLHASLLDAYVALTREGARAALMDFSRLSDNPIAAA